MPSNLYKRGTAYYGRFSVNGELQRVSLRTSDLGEARRRLKAIRQKAERQAFGLGDAPTWEAAVVAYSAGILDQNGVKPSTAKRYRVSLRQAAAAFKGKPLPAIERADIAVYVTGRQQAGATNATIRRDLTTVSRVLAYAAGQGWCAGNVVDQFDRDFVKERRKALVVPDDATIRKAAAGVRADLGELILFLRATGLRAGEALRARREDIHDGSLTIHETKSGRVRTIDLDGAVAPVAGAGRLFPTLADDSGRLASLWQRERAKVEALQRFRIHDLRHAYAIAEVRAGRDIYDLSHHLGHSSVKVTEIYLGYAAGRRASSRTDTKHDTSAGK